MEYRADVEINSENLPIISFAFEAPAGRVGVNLSAQVADVTASVQRGDDLNFKIHRGSQKAHLIRDGFVLSRDEVTASEDTSPRPADSLSFTGSDKLGDRFDLAPRAPVVLFDPELVAVEEGELDTNINDADGNRIYAEARAIPTLDLLQVLRFAFVEGCGFDGVVTNVENYRLPRADFSIESSYYDVAIQYVLGNRSVIYEDDSIIYIIDARQLLPAGMADSAPVVDVDKYISLARQKPARSTVNAVLLTMHDAGVFSSEVLPEDITTRLEQENIEEGIRGQVGWQLTEILKFITEVHDPDDFTKIIADPTIRTETTVTGIIGLPPVETVLSFEVQTDFYDYNFARKVGYEKTLTIFALGIPIEAQTETNRIFWAATGKPGEFMKVWETTSIEGLFFRDGDQAISYVEANSGGSLEGLEDAVAVFGPISSKTTRFTETGADEVEIKSYALNQMTGRHDANRTTQHTGTIRIDVRRGQQGQTKRLLLHDPDSDTNDGPRKPISFDSGYLPFASAQMLALRALADAQSPPERIACTLAKPDFGLRRGSLRKFRNREGTTKLAIILGYRITGEPQGRGLLLIRQGVEALVIG